VHFLIYDITFKNSFFFTKILSYYGTIKKPALKLKISVRALLYTFNSIKSSKILYLIENIEKNDEIISDAILENKSIHKNI